MQLCILMTTASRSRSIHEYHYLHLAIFVILRVPAQESHLSHLSYIVFFVNKQDIQKYLNLHFFRAKVKTRLTILLFNYTSKQNISSKAFGLNNSILFLQPLNTIPNRLSLPEMYSKVRLCALLFSHSYHPDIHPARPNHPLPLPLRPCLGPSITQRQRRTFSHNPPRT